MPSCVRGKPMLTPWIPAPDSTANFHPRWRAQLMQTPVRFLIRVIRSHPWLKSSFCFKIRVTSCEFVVKKSVAVSSRSLSPLPLRPPVKSPALIRVPSVAKNIPTRSLCIRGLNVSSQFAFFRVNSRKKTSLVLLPVSLRYLCSLL